MTNHIDEVVGKTYTCDFCGKTFDPIINTFNDLLTTYYLPQHYDNVGRQCDGSYNRVDENLRRLTLKELMGLPIDDIARYTGFVCGSSVLKDEITKLWEPEIKAYREMISEENQC